MTPFPRSSTPRRAVDPRVSARMRAVRQRNTAVEVSVRHFVHSHGLRYRVCPDSLPGRPDIANQRRRWAIFVHGCFWHGHAGCSLAREPKTNVTFWREKIAANRARDARKEKELADAGFAVFVIWQCEVEDAERSAMLLGQRLKTLLIQPAPFRTHTARPR
jgi:DNA mismatch endonuclease (patch repair protein)